MTGQEVAAEWVNIETLKPWENNPRKNEHAVSAVAESIKRFGFAAPIIARTDGEVIAGHTRLKAAQALGLDRVPVRYMDLDPADAKLLALADNKVGELAEWDDDRLSDILNELHADGVDLDGIGFSLEELSEIMALGAEMPEEEFETTEPEPDAVVYSQPGEVYQLGPHRLICGDSTKAKDVKMLMDGAKAELCFTSPPYALGKSVGLSGNKSMSAKASPYDDHYDNAHEWDQLMRGWFAASEHAVNGAWVVNVQPLAGNKRDLLRFIADNADQLVDVAMWDKGHAAPQIQPGVMASRFEWLLIFSSELEASRSIPLSSWRGTVQSVYAAPPQKNNEYAKVHAATMPLHLPLWVMKTLCDKTKSVYDPFCGTGTTLIAAAQLGRVCYGVEISPIYCDVIRRRWTAYAKQAGIDPGPGALDEAE